MATLTRGFIVSSVARSWPVVSRSGPLASTSRHLSGVCNGVPDLNEDNMAKHHFDHGFHPLQEWTTYAGKVAVLQNREVRPGKSTLALTPISNPELRSRHEWTLFHDKIPVLKQCKQTVSKEDYLNRSQQEWTTMFGKLSVLRGD